MRRDDCSRTGWVPHPRHNAVATVLWVCDNDMVVAIIVTCHIGDPPDDLVGDELLGKRAGVRRPLHPGRELIQLADGCRHHASDVDGRGEWVGERLDLHRSMPHVGPVCGMFPRSIVSIWSPRLPEKCAVMVAVRSPCPVTNPFRHRCHGEVEVPQVASVTVRLAQ